MKADSETVASRAVTGRDQEMPLWECAGSDGHDPSLSELYTDPQLSFLGRVEIWASAASPTPSLGLPGICMRLIPLCLLSHQWFMSKTVRPAAGSGSGETRCKVPPGTGAAKRVPCSPVQVARRSGPWQRSLRPGKPARTTMPNSRMVTGGMRGLAGRPAAKVGEYALGTRCPTEHSRSRARQLPGEKPGIFTLLQSRHAAELGCSNSESRVWYTNLS